MLATFILQLRGASPLELIAVFTGIVYVLLVVRRSRWCWVWGAVSSGVLAGLAFGAQLPLQAALQSIYVVMSAYGFWQWSRSQSATLKIKTWPWQRHIIALPLILVIAYLSGPWLTANTGAAWPRLDAAVMLASLLATYMVARVLLENWIYWIFVDVISCYLYAVQGLAFVALLYIIYCIIAIFGFRTWYQKKL